MLIRPVRHPRRVAEVIAIVLVNLLILLLWPAGH